MLIGGKRDFTGRLSYSWPKTAGQFTLNKGTPGYDPLFAFGHGLSYAKGGSVPALSEVAGVDASLANTSLFFTRGKVPAPFSLAIDAGVQRSAADSATTQEGAVQFTWTQAGTARITGPELALVREVNGDLNLQITYRTIKAPAGPAMLSLGGGKVDIGPIISATSGWQVLRVPLKCFRDKGANMAAVTEPMALTATAPFSIAISDLRLATDPAGAVCPK